MVANVLNVWGEIIGVIVGGVILGLFAITFSPLTRRPSVLPGSAGPRASRQQQKGHEGESRGEGSGSAGEVVRADGYIDSFAGVIQESGGGMPLIVKISIVAIPLWWLLYIIINFAQYLLSIRSFQ